MHTYIQTYIQTYKHTLKHTYKHICKHTYISIRYKQNWHMYVPYLFLLHVESFCWPHVYLTSRWNPLTVHRSLLWSCMLPSSETSRRCWCWTHLLMQLLWQPSPVIHAWLNRQSRILAWLQFSRVMSKTGDTKSCDLKLCIGGRLIVSVESNRDRYNGCDSVFSNPIRHLLYANTIQVI